MQAQSSNATLLPAGNIQILGSRLSPKPSNHADDWTNGKFDRDSHRLRRCGHRYGGILVTVASAQTPYQSWAVGYGLSGANAAVGADPDGDGWSNAQEYAFGLVPNVAGGQLVQVPAGELKMTYRQRGGVRYVVRSATNLETGFSGTVTPTRVARNPVGYLPVMSSGRRSCRVAGEGSSRWKRRWSRIEKFKIRNSKCEIRKSPRGRGEGQWWLSEITMQTITADVLID